MATSKGSIKAISISDRKGVPKTNVPAAELKTDFGIAGDAKEAVSFAILAWQTIRGATGNVPSATGARHPVVLGKIVPGC